MIFLYSIFILLTINSGMKFQICIYSFMFFYKRPFSRSIDDDFVLCFVLTVSCKNIRESP